MLFYLEKGRVPVNDLPWMAFVVDVNDSVISWGYVHIYSKIP